MSFLPFYMPSSTPPRVVIAGGGYAGMAALISLLRYCPSAEVTLIDPREEHFKITRLHEIFRPAPIPLRVPYSLLAHRFGFRHKRGALKVDDENLLNWHHEQEVLVDDERLPFDYLLLTTGVGFASVEREEHLLDLGDLGTAPAAEIVRRLATLDDGAPITLIGGGATGIQFLFEIDHWLKTNGRTHPLRLLDADERVLPQFTPALGKYVQSKMDEKGMEFLPNTLFLGQEGDVLRIEDKHTGEQRDLASGITFSFIGKRPSLNLETNPFGQVVMTRKTLPRIFAAGDCSRYHSVGSNAMTAQSALRKGKLCARNIVRHSGRLKVLEPYLHQDLGYLISLGPNDAVGWIGVQANVIAGAPAAVMKELVESQHDLLLAGIDTYLI